MRQHNTEFQKHLTDQEATDTVESTVEHELAEKPKEQSCLEG